MNGLSNRRVMRAALGLLVAGALMLRPHNGDALVIAGPDIIPAPSSVVNSPPGAVNDHQQAFDERQDVLLAAPLAVDGGVIAAGTVVSSQMIFLNIVGRGPVSDEETWTFDGIILGVMSDRGGTLEAGSSSLLGAVGTIYPSAFPNRGLEIQNDSYIVAGNMITLSNRVTQPGDWIRVITQGTPVPEPSSLSLLATSVGAWAGIIWLRSRRRI